MVMTAGHDYSWWTTHNIVVVVDDVTTWHVLVARWRLVAQRLLKDRSILRSMVLRRSQSRLGQRGSSMLRW